MNVTVTLTPDLEEFVNSQLQSGTYSSADAVVREGLVLLRDREELQGYDPEVLRGEIALGLGDVDQGKLSSLTAREILARVRQREKEGKRE